MKSADKWNLQEVVTWIRSLKLVKYLGAFQKHCIDGGKLCRIYNDDAYLQNVLGIKVRLHRVRIKRAFEQLNQQSVQEACSVNIDSDKTSGKVQPGRTDNSLGINQLAKHERVASAPSSMSRAHHKSRTKIQQIRRFPFCSAAFSPGRTSAAPWTLPLAVPRPPRH